MSNELINEMDNLSSDKLMSMLGQDADTGGSTLGRLSINYASEDDDGNLIKRGLFKVETKEQTIYAEKVSFRPFLNTFQYKKYDGDNEENNYKSVMFTSWTDAKPDTNGTDSCGSVPKALRDDLDPVSKQEQEKITCYRNVFGVVTIKGKTSSGAEASLSNEPVVYRARGVNFMPIGDQLKSLSRRNKIMYNTVLDFYGTEKKSMGKDSPPYFVAQIKDSNKDVKFSDDDKVILKDFLDYVKNENDYVKGEYEKSIKEKHKSVVSPDDLDDDAILEEMSA